MSAAPFMNTICRGLVGHVSYLATCSLSTVYSEYMLYEPIARIGQAKGYTVRCEVPVGTKKPGRGDHRRIDFLFTRDSHAIGLEVKWLEKNDRTNVTNDVEKLRLASCRDRFLVVFGRGAVLENLDLKADGKPLKAGGRLVRWQAGKTDYAAIWVKI